MEEPGADNPFLIYGRAGEPCPKRNGRIQTFVQAGRTTYYCPKCQPKRPASGTRAEAFSTRPGHAYLFEAHLPGTKEGDIEITITGNRLTISGTRVEEERRDDDRYYAMERAFGTFTRTFTLPEDADLDRIEARLDGGVLTVMVPKKESSKPRRIPLEGLKKTVEQLKEKVVEKLKR